MLPALMLLGIGRRRTFWIPLPLVLLWPFWLIGWAAWLLMAAARAPQARVVKLGLVAATRLSGLMVQLDSDNENSNIHLRMI